MFDRYRRSQPYQQKAGKRARYGYERAMRSIEDTLTKDGRTFAALPLTSISTRAVDRIYERLQEGPKKGRYTQANYAISIARRACKVVHRLHPDVVPTFNPWIGVERVGKKGVKAVATRVEAYTLAEALKAIGEPLLGAAALICFEWHQRPDHVVGLGELTWADWRPPQRSRHVQIRHPKIGAMVWLPLEDELRRHVRARTRAGVNESVLGARAILQRQRISGLSRLLEYGTLLKAPFRHAPPSIWACLCRSW